MESPIVLIIAGVVILMLLFNIRTLLTMANVSGRREPAYIQPPYSHSASGGGGGEWMMILVVVAGGIFAYSWVKSSADNPLEDKKPSSREQVAQFGGNKSWQEVKEHINEAPVSSEPEPELYPQQEPAPQQEPELYPDAPSYFCIQIEASAVEALALERAEKLIGKYKDIHVVKIEGYMPFKLVVGHFADEFSAKQAKVQLGIKDGFIKEVQR